VSVRRLEHIPGFNIDRVAAAAGDDPDVLRMENLDTDVPPPAEAVEATRAAVGTDDANSWLPFTGRDDLKDAVAAFIAGRGGARARRGTTQQRSSSRAAKATRWSTRCSA
jgi:aspartate/methionine/tyrosine aminotransferase